MGDSFRFLISSMSTIGDQWSGIRMEKSFERRVKSLILAHMTDHSLSNKSWSIGPEKAHPDCSIEQTLRERGFDTDFVDQISMLKTVIKEAGHECTFFIASSIL